MKKIKFRILRKENMNSVYYIVQEKGWLRWRTFQTSESSYCDIWYSDKMFYTLESAEKFIQEKIAEKLKEREWKRQKNSFKIIKEVETFI